MPYSHHERITGAAAARQTITLSGGDLYEVFAIQSRQIRKLANYIKTSLNTAENFRFLGNCIEFECPVFRCVSEMVICEQSWCTYTTSEGGR